MYVEFSTKGKKLEKYFDVLKKCPLFLDISDGELLKMLSCLDARKHSFEKNEYILSEGEPSVEVGILLSGSASISQIDYYGNRTLIGRVSPGEMFAEEFACASVKSLPIDVIADGACEALLINCSHILTPCAAYCGHHQKMIYNMMRDVAKKAIIFHKKIDVTAKRTTRDKLLTYLNYMAKEMGSNSFEIPFDRQELADYLEVDRSGLSVEIGKLRREGVIKNKKNHFEIL